MTTPIKGQLKRIIWALDNLADTIDEPPIQLQPWHSQRSGTGKVKVKNGLTERKYLEMTRKR